MHEADRSNISEDARRLEEILATGERVNAREYVALLRRISRDDPSQVLKFGASLYSFGLQQAFSDGDTEGVVRVAEMGALALDASGLHEPAIARLQQAVTLAAGEPAAQSRLLVSQAVLLANAGRAEEARSLSRRVSEANAASTPAIKGHLASVSCITLDAPDWAAHEAAIAANRAEGDGEGVASHVLVQLIARRCAAGDCRATADTAHALLDHATEVQHRARQIDAQVALIAIEARRGPVAEPEGLLPEAERLYNNHAMWKLLVAMYRQHLLRSDEAAADRCHGLLEQHHDWVSPGYRNAFAGLDQYRRCLLQGAPLEQAQTPGEPTLLSLPNILASAEAVALGASASAAAEWLAWLEDQLPAEVVTSMEWPACRRRIEGLLWLRLGHRDRAIERFAASVTCCEQRGDTIESGLARAQLAALRQDARAAVRATADLVGQGIDSSAFARAATRVAERGARVDTPLTVAEARVIGRVANGLSHREIEAEMELPARAASRAISRVYAKLGIQRRGLVAQVARDLLII